MWFRPHSYLCASILLLCWPAARSATQPRGQAGDVRIAHRARVRSAIDEAMGDLTWGMRKAELRARLASSLEGAASARDESFLRAELSHAPAEHAESLLVGRDSSARSFYFFASGKLWKVYRILEPLVFPEGNFGAFTTALQRRLGPARHVQDASATGELQRWSEWQDDKTRLRAIDQTDRYGFYCLVFEDKATLGKRLQRP